MVSIAKEKDLKVRKITSTTAGIQRKATLVAMQLWIKSRTQKELSSDSYGKGNYLHDKNYQKQSHTKQLFTNTKHLRTPKQKHANDKTRNTVDFCTTLHPAPQKNHCTPLQQPRSTPMSSPSKDSDHLNDNDGSELSATLDQHAQGLLQPGNVPAELVLT